MNAPHARTGHIACATGRYMIIWGGYQEDETFPDRYLPTDKIWVYATEINKWICLDTYGNIPPGTSGSEALILQEKLYLFGGHTPDGNTAELYCLDLKTREWKHLPVEKRINQPAPRDKHKGWVYGNSMFFYGGFGYPLNGYMNECNADFFVDETTWGRGWNNQLFEYDVTDDIWRDCQCFGSKPSARAAHDVALIGDELYLFGGRHQADRLNDLYKLHMKSMVWKRLYPNGVHPQGRSWHTLTAISHSRIILYGGYTQNCKPLSDSWILNTEALEWTQIQVPTTGPRIWHTACYFPMGDLLVFGGCSNDILQERAIHRNDIVFIQCSPYSLFRLSLETVCCYWEHLKTELSLLPQPIISVLEHKMENYSSSTQITGHNYGRNCCIL